MPKLVDRLNVEFVASVNAPGRYHDGAGLYLIVTAGGKSWLYRYTIRGRTREMGLGSVAAFPLAAARKRALACRQRLADGIDPLEAKQAARANQRAQEARFVAFEDEARTYIAAHRAAWKNAKHADQWMKTLQTYAFPVLGQLHVAAIDTDLVLKVLEPIWRTKTETASRVRGRIEKILAFSATRKFRAGENPARWRNHLEILLPARTKIAPVQHHAALPYASVGDFMLALRRRDGIAAKALAFTVLNAVRTGDTIGGCWYEIDRRSRIWTLPEARTKTRELRVPLTAASMAILDALDTGKPHDFIFRGRDGEPLSENAMLAVLDRMGYGDVATTHGMRSTFKDWAADCTGFENIVSEMALAHAVGDDTEEAYRRGDLFLKRRRLMEAWANYCARPSAKGGDVVTMQRVTR